jgi:hypothetical protein
MTLPIRKAGPSSHWDAHLPEIDKLLKQDFRPCDVVKHFQSHGLVTEETRDSLRLIASRRRAKMRDAKQYGADSGIETDKKISNFHWRDIMPTLKNFQQIVREASGSQDQATWKITTDKDICVAVVGDLQLGSWATDYDLFMKVTDEIINTPNLYVILVGDLLQMAIKLRGVLEAMDNLMPPKIQLMFLDSWLQDIKHKVICSTWDNHAVMREENQVGYSSYASIFSRHTIYHNHIGHVDIQVNDITYKWAVTHFFRGKSMLNNVHAPMRYMRMEAPDREIAVQGDFHVPGIAKYWEGGSERCAMVCGSIQTSSGFGQRFFSLRTCPTYPCIALSGTKKNFTPFWSIEDWVKFSS